MSKRRIFSLSDFGTGKPKAKEKSAPAPTKVTPHKSEGLVINPNGRIDVKRIHKHVMGIFDQAAEDLYDLQEKMQELLAEEFSTVEEQVLADAQCMSLEERITSLAKKLEEKSNYDELAQKYIEQFSQLVPQTAQRVLGVEHASVSSDNFSSYQIVLSEFLSLAQKFASDITVTAPNVASGSCLKCRGALIISGTYAQCSNCGAKVNLSKSSGSQSQQSYGDYYRADTFQEYIDHYQGRRKKPLPASVLEKIRSHCKRYRLKVEQLTKGELYNILKKYSLSEHYNSVNAIHHALAKSPLPDIREHEALMREKHRLIEEEYMLIKEEEGRSNFLYGWYVLQACLVMEGIPTKSEDFLTLTTRDALKDHDRIMMKICSRIRERSKEDSSIVGRWNFRGLA